MTVHRSGRAILANRNRQEAEIEARWAADALAAVKALYPISNAGWLDAFTDHIAAEIVLEVACGQASDDAFMLVGNFELGAIAAHAWPMRPCGETMAEFWARRGEDQFILYHRLERHGA